MTIDRIGKQGPEMTQQTQGHTAGSSLSSHSLPGHSVPGLPLPGVTDAFLTRLQDIDGSTPGNDDSFEEETAFDDESSDGSGLWYLYGRMVDQKKQNGTGIFLWASADLRHWSAPRPVLGVRDVPWAHPQPYVGYPASEEKHPVPGRPAPAHPAVMRCDGKVYLYFELDGQIGAAWAPSPAGPFTVRRTPLLRTRQWGRVTDPGVLGMAAEVDEFGGITPVTDRPVRTDWLLWRGANPGNGSGTDASGTVTLCTLGQDRMELALGVHRSREIRVTPEADARKDEQSDATATPTPAASRTVSPQTVPPQVISPQIVRLGGAFYLLWIHGTGRILSARADHLTGPWKDASAIVFADVNDGAVDASDGRTCAPGILPGSLSGIPVRLSVATGTAGAGTTQGSTAAQTVPNQAVLTVSDPVSTRFFILRVSGGKLEASQPRIGIRC